MIDAPLTEKQRRTLEIAAENGYFEVPREKTLAEIADEFQVSRQAVNQRIQRATNALVWAAIQSTDKPINQWVSSSLTDAELIHRSPNCPSLSGSTPKFVDDKTADWHDLKPCPDCAATATIGLQSLPAHQDKPADD